MFNIASYITTPIYYINGAPHIGHASTSVLADIMKRARRMHGVDTFLSTGTDEHGQKNEEKAAELGLSTQDYQDRQSALFRDLFDQLHVTYDHFCRTSNPYHKAIVSDVEQDLFDRSKLIKKTYTGSYCTGCEQFKKDSDLNEDGTCPDHPPLVAAILTEKNYFLDLEPFRAILRDKIVSDNTWITPKTYSRYVLSLLDEPLEPLCISRPKNRVGLGIALPFDKDYVTYVWLDALLNYLTNVNWPGGDSARWWSEVEHVIGKDIVKTHCVYWPCILMAMDMDLPKRITVHGHWVGEGGLKMSKSLGNVVDPLEVIKTYGTSALRYYIARHAKATSNSLVSLDLIGQAYKSDLSNKLGNLLMRCCKFSQSAFSGVPSNAMLPEDAEIHAQVIDLVVPAHAELCDLPSISGGVSKLMLATEVLNNHITARAPWKLVKNGDRDAAESATYATLDALRLVLEGFYPIIPEIVSDALKILSAHGVSPDKAHAFVPYTLQPGAAFGDIVALFPQTTEPVS